VDLAHGGRPAQKRLRSIVLSASVVNSIEWLPDRAVFSPNARCPAE
jgi:hypothetical protein